MGSSWQPPRAGLILLRILLPPSVREEMEGDLAEGYRERALTRGKTQANRWFWRQLRGARPFQLRRALREIHRSGPYREQDTRLSGIRGGPGWRSDFKSGLRYLCRRPGAAAIVVITIALAIAASTSVFSIVNGVLLRPLPYPNPESLLAISQVNEEWMESSNSILRELADEVPASVPIVKDWERESRLLQSIGSYSSQSFKMSRPEGAEFVQGATVTSGVFEVLQAPPLLGSWIPEGADEAGDDPVAVLSYGCWQRRFGGDPRILGTDLALGTTRYTIVGVMPEGFEFPSPEQEFWVSLRNSEVHGDRDELYLNTVARLSEGVSLESAQAEMDQVQARLSQAYPDAMENLTRVKLRELKESVVGEASTTLWFLLGSVLLAVAVACVNIANLLSVMGLARERELALRSALGAGTGALVRGRLVEVLLLVGLGGTMGVGMAALSSPVLAGLLPPEIPRQEGIGMDLTVLAFGWGTTLVTALVVGIFPALRSGLAHPGSLLAPGGRTQSLGPGARRARSLFVSAEMALAVILLVGAGLLGNSLLQLWTVDRGFDTRSLVVMTIVPDLTRFPEREDRDRFAAELQSRLSALPRVSVTAANNAPLTRSTALRRFELESPVPDAEQVPLILSVVRANYFEVMGIPVEEGRPLQPGDSRTAPPVALVNRTLAEAFWPQESALGKRIRRNSEEPWKEIVGITQDVHHQGLDVTPEPMIYVPASQSDIFPASWIARATSGDPHSLVTAMRTALRDLSPETPILRIGSLEEEIARGVAVPTFRTFFVSGLAGLSALLALLGVYGVVSFTLSQQTREIGIRMALGSPAPRVVGRAMRSGLAPASVGLVVGLAIALGFSPLVAEFLFRLHPADPTTYTLVALLVAGVSGAAAYFPARKAASVDPVEVLKTE